MTLQSSGSMSMRQIETELGLVPGSQHSFSEAVFRTLAGVPSGALSFSHFYGKSNVPPLYIATQPQGYDGYFGDWPEMWVDAPGATSWTWYRGTTLVVDGISFSGQGTAALAVNTSGTYHVVVSNGVTSITSANAIIHLVRETTCPAPEVLITMADGTEKAAGDLVVGDEVRAWDEDLRIFVIDRVSAVSRSVGERMRLGLSNGRNGVFERGHRFLSGNIWIPLYELRVGDVLEGGIVESVMETASGDVVKITIERTHTFITEGVVSHNVKYIIA